MRRRYFSKRILANRVYNDFISQRYHVHMNSTCWVTLSGFVRYLGESKKCIIDKTERGWYIQYIDNSPEAIQRKADREKAMKTKVSEEDRLQKFIQRQIEAQQEMERELEETAQIERGGYQDKDDEDDSEETKKTQEEVCQSEGAIMFDLNPNSESFKPSETSEEKQKIDDSDTTDKEPTPQGFGILPSSLTNSSSASKQSDSKTSKKRPRSHMDSYMEEKKESMKKFKEDKKAEPTIKDVSWVSKDIVIKILDKTLAGGKYFEKKGRIEKVVEDFVADVKLVNKNITIRLDQNFMETVVPKVGGQVKILFGKHKDEIAKVVAVNFNNYSCDLKIIAGKNANKSIDGVPYEHFSKYAPEFSLPG
mmetsp:Transcript_13417/g.14870  ORF Transcript_13417/g.14870 Transcript_13417/m.14870 type:complete len:364 (-) Transcript_13417:106-1197(-)